MEWRRKGSDGRSGRKFKQVQSTVQTANVRISVSGRDCGQLPTYEAAAIRYLGMFMRIRRRVWQYA